MAYELIQFSSATQQPRFGKIAIWVAGVPFVAGWMLSGMGVGIFWAIVGLAASGIVLSLKRNKEVYGAAKTDLAKRGHNIDFQLGNALIASKEKVIAFVNLSNKSYDLYDAHDILEWEHQWIDKTTASTNVWGNNVHSNTRRANNVLVIKTNNPAKPLYKIPLISHSAGEQWVARLGAIING
ncbi:MAG TPA: hypothetical protein VMV75_11140 [Sulfuricella sp.]|nr:hypothetical protein [Sulfuricella sp.]